MPDIAVAIDRLTHRYGERTAIDALSLDIPAGEIFGFLGPNGSGKSTLLRILSTLIPPQDGHVKILGMDLPAEQNAVRRSIGVVFQSPSLDRQLTAEENLRHQGHLYGMRGEALSSRIRELLERFQLADRAHERVDKFSGGMRRRVELAKGLLHGPRLLLLDEPSTGLDPRARIELMEHLRQIRDRDRASIVMTTHLMEEAEQCDRLAIMDQGKLVANEDPVRLKSRIGGDIITLQTRQPGEVAKRLKDDLKLAVEITDGSVRLEHASGHELTPAIYRSCPDLIESISIGKPTLLDVFIRLTGRRFDADAAEPARP